MRQSKKKECHLAGRNHHLCARTGSKMKAKVAIARKLRVIVHHVLSTLKPREEPKPKGHLSQSRQKRIQRHLRELRTLGLEVQITPVPA